MVSVQAILNSDRILIPTLCEPAVLKRLSEAVQLIRDERPNMPIKVLRIKYKPRLVLTKEADEMLVEAASSEGYQLLETTIPDNIKVAESVAAKETVLEYAPKSSSTRAYQSLARECIKNWGIK